MIALRTPQLIGLSVSTLLAFVCLAALHLMGVVNLARFLGEVAPLPTAGLMLVAGLLALVYLQRTENLMVASSGRGRGLRVAALLSLPFAVGVTVIDVLHPFPADMNVSLPAALIFYPAIGLVAQMAMHIVPFAVLVMVGRMLSGGQVPGWWLWASVLIASTIEALFQMAGARGGSTLLITYLAISLFLFGIAELHLYRRFDYLTMFAFRMLYYGYWHIGWGSLRLMPGFPAGN